MHRTIEITLPPATTDTILGELEKMDGVVGLAVHRGSSILPPGDVVIVHALNRDTDEVLSAVERARKLGPISVVTAEVASIIDPDRRELVDNDVDEAVWEEAQTGLRHQGRVTANFLTLMALGGAIGATGLVLESSAQAISFVAASIIAPGFEPIAKLPLGLTLRNWRVVKRGLYSVGAGYLVLMLAAAAMFALLRLTGTSTIKELLENEEVHKIAHPTLIQYAVSACAATAGVTMIMAYRRTVIAGPLLALVLIPAAALVGAGIAAGELGLALDAIQRLIVDAMLIVVIGAIVVAIKQRTVHHRQPMV